MEITEHDIFESWALSFGGTAILGFLSTLLILGKLSHHLLQRRGLISGFLVVPPAILSGLIGLAWFAIMECFDSKLADDLEYGLKNLRTNLVNFVFASLILGLSCTRTNSQHLGSVRGMLTSIFHEGMPMIIYSQILIWGQSMCCLLCVVILGLVGIRFPTSFAAMVPLGVEAGGDVNISPKYADLWSWSQTIVEEAESLGMIFTCVLGIAVISFKPLFVARGWLGQYRDSMSMTSQVTGISEAFHRTPSNKRMSTQASLGRSYSVGAGLHTADKDTSDGGSALRFRDNSFMSKGNFPNDNIPDLIYNSGGGGKNDDEKAGSGHASLGAHLSLIALTVFLSFGISFLARLVEIEWRLDHQPLSGVPMFKISMCCALICMHLILTSSRIRFKREWFMRLCGLMLDLLVIAALSNSNPKPHEVEKSTHYVVCAIFVCVCIGWNVVCFIFVAKEIFPNFWFERGITLSADALGHCYAGLLFARTLDPLLESPVPAAYAYKVMILFIPSSGSKNKLIVSLVQSHGIFVALIICICVLATWLLIFENYFRHRFIFQASSSSSSSSQAHSQVTSSNMRRDGGGSIMGILSFDSHDSLDGVVNERGVDGKKGGGGSGPGRKSGIKDSLDSMDTPAVEQVEKSPERDKEGRRSQYTVSTTMSSTMSTTTPPTSPYGVSKSPSLSTSFPSISPSSMGKNKNNNNKIGNIDLSEPSLIVNAEQMSVISSWLPPSRSNRGLTLKYSLRRDGANLSTLLSLCRSARRNGMVEQEHHIIIIEDSWGYVFGGYISHSLEDRSNYYGNGESFVFSLTPKEQVYRWTGENNFFILSDCQCFAMGGGGSGFAFQLDDELDTGVSNCSATYGNEQLSSSEFFKCLNVEVWTVNSIINEWV